MWLCGENKPGHPSPFMPGTLRLERSRSLFGRSLSPEDAHLDADMEMLPFSELPLRRSYLVGIH